MTTFTVDAKSYAALFRKQERDRRRAAIGAVGEAAMLGQHIVTKTIDEKQIHDLGILRASVHVERIGKARQIVVDAPHAGIIEMGSRPHMPPEQPILDWVERHLESFGIKKVPAQLRRRSSSSYRVLTEAQLRARDRREYERQATHRMLRQAYEAGVGAIVAAIRWKIFRKGTPPHWFMRDALPKLRAALKELVERRMRDPGNLPPMTEG